MRHSLIPLCQEQATFDSETKGGQLAGLSEPRGSGERFRQLGFAALGGAPQPKAFHSIWPSGQWWPQAPKPPRGLLPLSEVSRFWPPPLEGLWAACWREMWHLVRAEGLTVDQGLCPKPAGGWHPAGCHFPLTLHPHLCPHHPEPELLWQVSPRLPWPWQGMPGMSLEVHQVSGSNQGFQHSPPRSDPRASLGVTWEMMKLFTPPAGADVTY